jgi:TRAP-type C4-dicarboxylate transport system substrate-binding protein
MSLFSPRRLSMRTTTNPIFFLPLAVALVLPMQQAWSRIDPEDQKLIDAASCEEIVREHKNYVAAEKEAEAHIRGSNAGSAATNIAGIAAFATLGFGIFTWNDNTDAEEALAEVRDIRIAIAEGARKKGCVLAP